MMGAITEGMGFVLLAGSAGQFGPSLFGHTPAKIKLTQAARLGQTYDNLARSRCQVPNFQKIIYNAGLFLMSKK